jgi:large subunit ribosomal protein L13
MLNITFIFELVMAVKATKYAKHAEVKRDWFVVDATDMVVGRLATEVAKILRGKHKPIYTPSTDVGDFVIVINAEKAVFKGAKFQDKKYFRHTGHPGGIKETTPRLLELEGKSERVIEKAVQRMISRKAVLGRDQFSKLFVYTGAEHPHAAQQPKVLDIASQNIKNKKTN